MDLESCSGIDFWFWKRFGKDFEMKNRKINVTTTQQQNCRNVTFNII